jgi:hypothetical protein
MNKNIYEEMQDLPVLNIRKNVCKYVLIVNDGNKKTPVKYSNDINTLLNELNKIMTESVFKYKKVKENMIVSEDLGLTYEIISSTDLFK